MPIVQLGFPNVSSAHSVTRRPAVEAQTLAPNWACRLPPVWKSRYTLHPQPPAISSCFSHYFCFLPHNILLKPRHNEIGRPRERFQIYSYNWFLNTEFILWGWKGERKKPVCLESILTFSDGQCQTPAIINQSSREWRANIHHLMWHKHWPNRTDALAMNMNPGG